jgi:hypothetical protein
MAKHEITMQFPSHEVVNSDVTIKVKSDNVLLGRIEISKGSIDWWPANNFKNHYRLTWESFQRLLEENGRQVKREP